MGALCGYVSRNEISGETFKKMSDTMTHRGPNGGEEERCFADGRYVGLAHRRLSVTDSVEAERQPLRSYDKSVSVVYDGDIFNRVQLMALLDYPFVLKDAAELIMASYLKWGIDCLTRLNGAFAFALYDHRDDTLYLVCDRVGEKPLYYWIQDGNIVFSTMLKALMAYPGFPKAVRKETIPRYLYQGYIKAPDTGFENTWKVEPGHFLKFKNGQISDVLWWDLVKRYHEKRKEPVCDYQEAKEALKEKLLQSVRLRIPAEAQPATFLSGGYDSTLVTALVQSVSDIPVKTFCIGFNEEKMNEAPYARAIADRLGTEHTEKMIAEDDMLRLVESIPDYYDEPFADSSQIPTMLVSEIAKRDVPVVLTGDAGDEFFCGYGIYDIMPKAWLLDFPGAVMNTIGKLSAGAGKTLLDGLPFMVQTMAKNRDPDTKTQFGGHHYIEVARKIAGTGLPEYYPVERGLGESNWQRRRMLLDMTHYLPGDCLVKVDRASAKYGLDARSPFLDVDVMEYSFAMKHDFKYKRGIKKRILKDLTYEFIPQTMLDRPKKGFSVPLDQWLRGPLLDQIITFSRSDMLKKQGVFNPEETQRFVDGYLTGQDGARQSGKVFSKTVWSYFVFQLWYDKYIGGL